MGKKRTTSSLFLNLLFAGIFIFGASFFGLASSSDESHGDEKIPFDAGEMILHHIADANEFHVVGDFSIPLPVMIYNRDSKGWFFGLSSAFQAHHGDGSVEVDSYVMHHSRIVPAKNIENEAEILRLGSKIEELEKKLSSEKGQEEQNEVLISEIESNIMSSNTKIEQLSDKYIDFSITKNVFTLILSVILLLLIFISVAKAYKRREGQAPKGLQSFIEPIIVFVRDEIAKPSIGEQKYMKFMPFLLTIFFFIWLNNIMGLVPFFPGGSNLTGNIAVPLVMAIFTLVITTVNGNRHYWQHIFAMPGVPKWVLVIITPLEILGAFVIKPATLTIRLFANITAGHIVILVFISLIFIFGQSSAGVGYAVSVPSMFFAIFLNLLELLVGAIQAYVFTLLSAIYFGAAVAGDHH